ncbi:MAG: hypothetical protein V1844_13050 [Pseudomonadota bacterium]
MKKILILFGVCLEIPHQVGDPSLLAGISDEFFGFGSGVEVGFEWIDIGELRVVLPHPLQRRVGCIYGISSCTLTASSIFCMSFVERTPARLKSRNLLTVAN